MIFNPPKPEAIRGVNQELSSRIIEGMKRPGCMGRIVTTPGSCARCFVMAGGYVRSPKFSKSELLWTYLGTSVPGEVTVVVSNALCMRKKKRWEDVT